MHGYRNSHGGDLNENDNFMRGNSSYMVTKIVLSCRLGFACAAVQSALPSGKAKGKTWKSVCLFVGKVDAALASQQSER